MATREEIEQVKASINIVDVISPYVALKRSGHIWRGLCPFHSEKTPSFDVNPDKGFWYCRGQCAMGGDAFKFLERIEGLSFGDSLERLAQTAGIALTRSGRDSSVESSRRERMYQALECAATYYQETLAHAEGAKRYLAERGVAHDTVASFRLGYAGESYDGLANTLRRSKIPIEDALEAGVLAQSERGQGSPYDKMRGRVVCPILDVHDRPIAFGGRLMESAEGRPKYLNTAETPLFSKGRTFFALSRARRSIANLGYAVVVEGYFDVISAHQAGFANVVATLGTASTEEHADILRRQAQRVILAFDADAAGFKAAQRASAIFEGKEIETLVLDMPRGEDPDSLLRAGRAADFQRAIDNAAPIREFQLRTVIAEYEKRYDLTSAQKARVFTTHVVPILRAVKSEIERDRLSVIAARLHPLFEQGAALAEDQVRNEVKRNGLASSNRSEPEAITPDLSPEAISQKSGLGNPDQRRKYARKQFSVVNHPQVLSPPNDGVRTAEENLLRALVSEDEELGCAVRGADGALSLFVSPAARELARHLLPITKQNEAEQKLLEVITSANVGEQDTISEHSTEITALASMLLGNVHYEQKKRPGDTPPSNEVGSVAPINLAAVHDSLARLERYRVQNSDYNKQLSRRVDQGDVAAAMERLKMAQLRHLGSADAGGADGAGINAL